jgi:hypothetical protein
MYTALDTSELGYAERKYTALPIVDSVCLRVCVYAAGFCEVLINMCQTT